MRDNSPYSDLGGDVVIINDAGPFAPWIVKRGVHSRKKPRYTIEVVSEPLLHDFDEEMLGAGPAEAIRDALSRAIKNIGEFAKPSTIRKREQAKRALEGLPPKVKGQKRVKRSRRYRGTTVESTESWYEKRYAGGRTGLKLPAQTDRLFNDSERFAEGLFTRQNLEDRSFTTNVPANRLNPDVAFGAPERFGEMLNKLRSLAPELQDARRLLLDPAVTGAINDSIKLLITKAEAQQAQKLEQLWRARKRALLAGLKLLGAAAGL